MYITHKFIPLYDPITTITFHTNYEITFSCGIEIILKIIRFFTPSLVWAWHDLYLQDLSFIVNVFSNIECSLLDFEIKSISSSYSESSCLALQISDRTSSQLVFQTQQQQQFYHWLESISFFFLIHYYLQFTDLIRTPKFNSFLYLFLTQYSTTRFHHFQIFSNSISQV